MSQFTEEDFAEAIAQNNAPATSAEMRDAFMLLIWEQRASLKGVALVQALNSLAKLATVETAPVDNTPVVDVLDLIEGDGVLPERKKALLTAERGVTVARLARIDTELEKL